MIGSAVGILLNTAVVIISTALQLLPFLLIVSIDEDLDGHPETTESYAVWADPASQTAEVRGPDRSVTGLQIHRARLTHEGWAMDVSLQGRSQHLEILVPPSGKATAQVNGNLTLTARPTKGWHRGTVAEGAL